MIALGALVGVPVIYYGVYREVVSGRAFPYSFVNGQQYNYWASLLVSFAWVGAVMLACRSTLLLPLTRRLAAVGRMAFSNYIFHTLVCTTVFYGHGFRLFGKVERVGQLAMVLAIWAFQLVVSPVWLRYFLFGPLEWLWRCVDLPAMGAVSAACFRLAVLRRLFRPLPGFRPTLSNPGGLVFVDTPNTRGFLAAINEDCCEPDNLPLRVLSHSISFCAPAH